MCRIETKFKPKTNIAKKQNEISREMLSVCKIRRVRPVQLADLNDF